MSITAARARGQLTQDRFSVCSFRELSRRFRRSGQYSSEFDVHATAWTRSASAATDAAASRGRKSTIVVRMGPDRSTERATLHSVHSGPRIYRPASPLADYIEFIGDWRSPEVDYWSRALPRGAVTVIFDVGQRQQLNFYAADGKTRLSVPPAFVTGSHTASYVSNIAADEPVMAVHFRPGGAFPFLGIPLSELENTYVGLDQVWGRDGLDLHERLIDAPSTEARFGIVEQFLLSRPWSSVYRDPCVGAAMAAIEGNPSVRMADIRDLVGMSAKRLIAAFRAEVGLFPKAYARIRRLQAALRLLNAGSVGGARVAADVGYFDQAHFVREFRSFTGMTPTQYAEQRILLPSHVPVVRHKYPRPLAAACS
jgi:AraC-like DNA-binding protein